MEDPEPQEEVTSADQTPINLINIEEQIVTTDQTTEVFIETEPTSACPIQCPQQNEISFVRPTLFASDTLMELSKSSWSRSTSATKVIQPYLRGCKWSPDGTCCLCVVNNDGMHLIELPRDLYNDSVSADRSIDVLDTAIHVKESGLVYDFCWYPGMNSSYPETCCWLTTIQNAPIQMWDAFDGSLRCTYRGYNSVDEVEPAISVTFSIDGSKIIAGYKNCLKTFDVNRPGRDCSNHKISFSPSCFAVDLNIVAVGSWNTAISLYSINEMGTYKSIGKMHGHCGGVTHMKFSPDGLKLVSGARKDHRLLVWDVRNFRRPINILSRAVDTNQRIYFDISPCGRYLTSGGTDGILKVWDSNNIDWTDFIDTGNVADDNATYKFPLHNDCCNSVAIHPFKTIMATGSGQYHFTDPADSLDRELSEAVPKMEETPSEVHCTVNNKYSDISENSLVFWWTGEVPKT